LKKEICHFEEDFQMQKLPRGGIKGNLQQAERNGRKETAKIEKQFG
jgi:hypothetical protein